AAKCRENMILEYFGESRDGQCQKCDYCREKRNNGNSIKGKEKELIHSLLEFISKRPNGVDFRIISHNFTQPREIIAEMLSFLVCEGFIHLRNNAYYPAEKN
ncbi:MAG: RecQ family zinc-binding domain-containing protein, partial [Muribaculaceae bacterium]|nr:RecQ family zinc-binding domain-containing protein [Muribaculaceae bacterium]